MPFALTEHGALVGANVLRSRRAIQSQVRIEMQRSGKLSDAMKEITLTVEREDESGMIEIKR